MIRQAYHRARVVHRLRPRPASPAPAATVPSLRDESSSPAAAHHVRGLSALFCLQDIVGQQHRANSAPKERDVDHQAALTIGRLLDDAAYTPQGPGSDDN